MTKWIFEFDYAIGSRFELLVNLFRPNRGFLHFTALTTKLTAVNRYSTPNFEVNHSMIILLLFLTWKFTRGFLFSPDLFFGHVKTFWNLVKILTCTWLYLNQFLWTCQNHASNFTSRFRIRILNRVNLSPEHNLVSVLTPMLLTSSPT